MLEEQSQEPAGLNFSLCRPALSLALKSDSGFTGSVGGTPVDPWRGSRTDGVLAHLVACRGLAMAEENVPAPGGVQRPVACKPPRATPGGGSA